MTAPGARSAPIRRILLANRGEIAMRVIRTCRARGIEVVLAVSEADRDSEPARCADRVVCVGPARAADSYLNARALVTAAIGTGCDAVHPGYGFLAESADFAELCREADIRFIGPRAEMLRLFGDKIRAKQAAEAAGVPVAPGLGATDSLPDAVARVKEHMFPLLLKPVHGGGGKGMRVARDMAEMQRAFPLSRREAAAAFGDGTLYLEKWIGNARHVEVQIAGDGRGGLTVLSDRDCTVQRRHQKLIEEAPAPFLSDQVRSDIHTAAAALGQHCRYDNVGTVEFVYDKDSGDFYFLEVNARIQVEHPVTEMVTGIDLVDIQLALCESPDRLPPQAAISVSGHAIEVRINAEDPEQGFRPSPGRITGWSVPEGDDIRVDTHAGAGYLVPPFYDSLLAKVIGRGADRSGAIAAVAAALRDLHVGGIATTAGLGARIVRSPEFRDFGISTRWLDSYLDRASEQRAPSTGVSAGGTTVEGQ